MIDIEKINDYYLNTVRSNPNTNNITLNRALHWGVVRALLTSSGHSKPPDTCLIDFLTSEFSDRTAYATLPTGEVIFPMQNWQWKNGENSLPGISFQGCAVLSLAIEGNLLVPQFEIVSPRH